MAEDSEKAGIAAATEALAATGIGRERRILRLTERLKDAVVDNKLTDLDEIRELFRDCYRDSVLKGVTEEGEARGV